MSPDDAILLFPEGGNWTPRPPSPGYLTTTPGGPPEDAADAAGNPHVLPPRPAGLLACLLPGQTLTSPSSPTPAWRTWSSEADLAGTAVSARPMVIRWWHEPASLLPDTDEDRRSGPAPVGHRRLWIDSRIGRPAYRGPLG